MIDKRPVWPKFIAIEGIDGSGTTTLTRNLAGYCRKKKLACHSGFEPTDGEIGQLIRRVLAGKTILSMESLALLFAADRREHLYGPGGIESVINQGDLYISDRYLFSSLAYQSLDSDWNWVNELNSSYPLPGLLIYLELPANQAMARLSARKNHDIYENEEFQRRVSKAYEKSIEKLRHQDMRTLILDSRQSPESILKAAIDAVFPIQ